MNDYEELNQIIIKGVERNVENWCKNEIKESKPDEQEMVYRLILETCSQFYCSLHTDSWIEEKDIINNSAIYIRDFVYCVGNSMVYNWKRDDIPKIERKEFLTHFKSFVRVIQGCDPQNRKYTSELHELMKNVCYESGDYILSETNVNGNRGIQLIINLTRFWNRFVGKEDAKIDKTEEVYFFILFAIYLFANEYGNEKINSLRQVLRQHNTETFADYCECVRYCIECYREWFQNDEGDDISQYGDVLYLNGVRKFAERFRYMEYYIKNSLKILLEEILRKKGKRIPMFKDSFLVLRLFLNSKNSEKPYIGSWVKNHEYLAPSGDYRYVHRYLKEYFDTFDGEYFRTCAEMNLKEKKISAEEHNRYYNLLVGYLFTKFNPSVDSFLSIAETVLLIKEVMSLFGSYKYQRQVKKRLDDILSGKYRGTHSAICYEIDRLIACKKRMINEREKYYKQNLELLIRVFEKNMNSEYNYAKEDLIATLYVLYLDSYLEDTVLLL